MRQLQLTNRFIGNHALNALVWLAAKLAPVWRVLRNKTIQRRALLGATVYLIGVCGLLIFTAASFILATSIGQPSIALLGSGHLISNVFWLMWAVTLIAFHIWLIDVSISRLITLYKHEHNQQ